eukprot:augustus_masked-scaffold_18-processed-gene-5.8-mRNA-1 protein AED:0.08 eAED:0.08 QI:0/-1/0/1/-1/1/1/0/202
MNKLVVIDKFCLRQFNSRSGASNQIKMSVKEVEEKLNKLILDEGGLSALKPGYAPFCKHLFVENFCGLENTTIEINSEVEKLIKTRYHARNQNELPVLERFCLRASFDKLPRAKYLDCILYSREQIRKENTDMGEKEQETDAAYGVVSIKPQDVDYELPMNPITQFRNALGKEHGGSEVPINAEEYRKSVDFWSKHVSVLDE